MVVMAKIMMVMTCKRRRMTMKAVIMRIRMNKEAQRKVTSS